MCFVFSSTQAVSLSLDNSWGLAGCCLHLHSALFIMVHSVTTAMTLMCSLVKLNKLSHINRLNQMETLCSMTMPGQTHEPFYPGTQFYHAFVFPCAWYEVFLSLCVLNCNSMNLMDIYSKAPCGSVSMHTKEAFITYYNIKTNTSFLKDYYFKIPRNINKWYSTPLQKQRK